MKWHHNLDVWKRSMDLAVAVYKMTDAFPRSEAYGLTQQMRRAAISIPSNIAEGAGRKGSKEFIQFLSTAQGSVAELETQLLIADRLRYAKGAAEILKELDQISKMIIGLQSTIRSRNPSPRNSNQG